MGFGVEVFFVVSGFLITHLLLNEIRTFGSISLRLFYIRRFLRIAPPLIFFLLALAFLSLLRVIATPHWDLLYCTLFIRNFFGTSPQTAHCWSLSVEEHFYLVWPFLLVLLRTHRLRLLFCLAVILATPFWSTFIYQLAGGANHANSFRTDLRLSGLAIGSALACVRFIPSGLELFQSRWMNDRITVSLAFFVVVLSLFSNVFSLRIIRAFAPLISSAGVMLLINAAISYPEIWWVRILEARPIVLIGKMSYSIYLWQQLCMPSIDDENVSIEERFIRLCLAILVAWLMFGLIEKPLLRYRSRFRR